MDEVIKSLVFDQYNKARKAKRLESSRVERALGLVQSENLSLKIKEYGTTIHDCGCPDRVVRGFVCKHMIACMILYRVYQKVQLLWLGEIKNPHW